MNENSFKKISIYVINIILKNLSNNEWVLALADNIIEWYWCRNRQTSKGNVLQTAGTRPNIYQHLPVIYVEYYMQHFKSAINESNNYKFNWDKLTLVPYLTAGQIPHGFKIKMKIRILKYQLEENEGEY